MAMISLLTYSGLSFLMQNIITLSDMTSYVYDKLRYFQINIILTMIPNIQQHGNKHIIYKIKTYSVGKYGIPENE